MINKEPLKYTLLGIGICFLVFLVFSFGVSVGYKKAAYSGKMGDNYNRIFIKGDPNRNMFPQEGFAEGHGAIGKIVDINPPKILISTRDNLEKTVITTDKTAFKQFRDDIKITDLKTGQTIITFGRPSIENPGNIEALLIRVAPDDNNK